jgi:DNA-directed RNA polymerase I, II, and III subunit RPABC3
MTTLFDDIFKVNSVDSARYDRVSRITAQSNSSPDIYLTLDINHELFAVSKNTNITVTLAQTLSLDGDVTMHSTGWREPKPDEQSLADDYDYVMYGTIYKFEESASDKV